MSLQLQNCVLYISLMSAWGEIKRNKADRMGRWYRRRLLPRRKRKYTVCYKCRKCNGKPVFGKVLWDGRKKNLGGKWKEKDYNIQMADWDLASWDGEKVTETNGFLRLVWLRGCTKPEIMCWYLLGAAWRWLILISGPRHSQEAVHLSAALSSPYMSGLVMSEETQKSSLQSPAIIIIECWFV